VKPFSSLVARSGVAIGTWSQIASAEVVDIIGASGFDFTIVDTEHGAFALETAENLVRACDAAGIVPIVRVPSNETWMITKALDIGAAAVVVPKIASVAEAERAVSSSRFAPQGTRGACPCIRAGDHFVRDWREFAGADNAAGVIALIEMPQAIDAIEAIASISGLSGLICGPFDLSVSMGLDGDSTHPRVVEALDRVAAAATRAGVPLIMPIFHPQAADCAHAIERWRERGVRLFTVGTDKLLLADYCSRYVSTLRRE
jgi:4-hydroxy-2-oxoheptanedioate aldolase